MASGIDVAYFGKDEVYVSLPAEMAPFDSPLELIAVGRPGDDDGFFDVVMVGCQDVGRRQKITQGDFRSPALTRGAFELTDLRLSAVSTNVVSVQMIFVFDQDSCAVCH